MFPLGLTLLVEVQLRQHGVEEKTEEGRRPEIENSRETLSHVEYLCMSNLHSQCRGRNCEVLRNAWVYSLRLVKIRDSTIKVLRCFEALIFLT